MSTALALPTGTEVALAPGSPEFERAASFMAREYSEATAEIRRLMLAIHVQSERMESAFRVGAEHWYNPFQIGFEYNGHRERFDGTDRIFDEMKRRAWRVLVDHLGIKNLMSVAKRREFEEQLERGELPDINERAILGILLGLVDQAKDFAREAAKEVFDILRPRGAWGGKYKTNDAFRVGRKVILPWRVERCYNGRSFRTRYNHEQELTAIDGVFHLLDGQGVMREHKGPLVQAVEASPDGTGETAYFRFKCFKNGNLHLEMKRLDLVRELNGLAAGEYVLGDDTE
jgi:hypothetical protein